MVEIAISLIALGLFAFLGFIYWVNYKKSVNVKKQVDPIWRGVFLAIALSAVLFLGESVGYFTKGWNAEHYWLHGIILVLCIIVFMVVALRKKPLSFEKLKEIFLDVLHEQFNAEVYKAEADIHWLNYYRITVQGTSEDTRGVVAVFMVTLKSATTMEFFGELNAFTGEILTIEPHPSLETKDTIKKQQTSKRDYVGSQFEDEEQVQNGTPATTT